MRTRTKSRFSLPVVIAIIVLCLACLCVTVGGLFYFGDTLLSWFIPTPEPTVIYNPPPVTPQSQVVTPSAPTEWTVIIYSDADDEVLESSMWFDVNEMELVGSTDQVNIIVQIDRHRAAFTGDGNWTSTRRYRILQDDNLDAILSPVLMDLGEVDMGDPQTLVDFTTWAIQNFPADKYALIMSDHGGGWTGGFSDGSSASNLTIPAIAGALDSIIANTGIEKFELFGFDACLMAQMEIFGTFYPVTNYMVASEEVIPAFGWAYTGFLSALVQNPAMDGGELSQAIVSSYVITDTFLTNNRSTDEEIAEHESSTTLSAVESARVPAMIDAMNQLINAMANLDQRQVAEARTYAKTYASVFGESASPSYLDLVNFAQILTNITNDPAIQQATLNLQTAVASAVIAEKHGATMSGSNGVAFYFPDSEIYSFTELSETVAPYGDAVDRFLQQSSWDEYMAFHYTGVAYVPVAGQAYVPDNASEIVAPGASELTIGPLLISDIDITGDEFVTVSTTVTGNVAYIYTIFYFYNPDTSSYWVGDISYYIADNLVEIDGVNSPDYGPSPVEVSYEWSPSLYILTDGTYEAFALLEPAEYLSSDGLTIYAVYGQYTPLLTNTPVDAVLSFDTDGNYLYAYAYPDSNEDGTTTPVEITPQPGDTFTDYVQSILFDENDEPYYDYSLSNDVWTWGDVPFSYFAAYPVDGEYAVGILAYDFDNNFVETYEYITYTR